MIHTGADTIADGLASLGVCRAFGIVSIHNMPIFDAVRRLGAMRIIDTSHEQAATHAADGYARVTGGVGVVIGSTGPGTTNTLTGLCEAKMAGSPVLLVTGQSETGFLGKGLGYVHELDQQAEILKALDIPVASPRRVEDIGPALERVLAAMRRGRPTPGAIELPIDLQYSEAPRHEFSQPGEATAMPDEADLDEIVELLLNARRRLIIAGGGAAQSGSADALKSLAELLDAPVLTTATGRGALDEGHPLSLGALWNSRSMHAESSKADVTLALGTRFKVGVDGADARFRPSGKLIQVDLDEQAIGLVHPVDKGVVADIGATLNGLLARLRRAANEIAPQDSAWIVDLRATRDGLVNAMWKRLGPDVGMAMRSLLAHLPSKMVLVRDTTMLGYTFVNQIMKVAVPHCFIYPTTAAIGPGLPLAVGAASGAKVPTLLVSGDGGFLYHATELATAAREKLPLTCLVINDGGYGVLRGLQANRFDGRWGNTDLGVVDFAALAASLGVSASRVSTPQDFEKAVKIAFETDSPQLIDFDVTGLAPMAGQLMPRQASRD